MKIYFVDTVHPILWEQLSKNSFNCVDATNLSKTSILEIGNEVEGLVIRSRFTLDVSTLIKFPNLKFIARSGSGLENIDVEYCTKKDIKVFNSPEGNRTAVAEHAIGMLLSLFNNLKRGDEEVKSGIWKREENRGIEIEGKTIGIVGFGNTGEALAKRLQGFDCTILAYDKYKTGFENNYVNQCTLSKIKQQADVLSFHVPYNEETHYYFNEDFLESMAKPFYLINTSRGKVVKTEAVIEGLKSKKLLGACIDVLEFESSSFEKIDPSFKSALSFLKEQDNVILSPHVAGWTSESYVKLSSVLADKILAAFNS